MHGVALIHISNVNPINCHTCIFLEDVTDKFQVKIVYDVF